MNIHNALNPNSDVERLYIPGKEVSKFSMTIEEVVSLAILGLESHLLMNYFS